MVNVVSYVVLVIDHGLFMPILRVSKLENTAALHRNTVCPPVLSTCYNHFIPIIVCVGKRGEY